MVSGAAARRTTQNPAEANGTDGARGASRSGSASTTTIHAPFKEEVQNRAGPRQPARRAKMTAEILAEAANPVHAARARRVSAARLAPTSGQIVTQIQLGSWRTDSLVQILHAQPASRSLKDWTKAALRRSLGFRERRVVLTAFQRKAPP